MKVYLVRNKTTVDCGFLDKRKAHAYLKALRDNQYYDDFYVAPAIDVIE